MWNHPERNSSIRKAVTGGHATISVPDRYEQFPIKLIPIITPVYYANYSAIYSWKNEDTLADGFVEVGIQGEEMISDFIQYTSEMDLLFQLRGNNGQSIYRNDVRVWPSHTIPITSTVLFADESWTFVCASGKWPSAALACILAVTVAIFWLAIITCVSRIMLMSKSFGAARKVVWQKKGLLFNTQVKLHTLAINASAVLRAIADALVLIDHEGFIQYANEKASLLFGYFDLCREVPLYERHFRHFFADLPEDLRRTYSSMGASSSGCEHGVSSSARSTLSSLPEGMQNLTITQRNGEKINAEANVSALNTRFRHEPYSSAQETELTSVNDVIKICQKLQSPPVPGRTHGSMDAPASGIQIKHEMAYRAVEDSSNEHSVYLKPCIVLFRDITAKLAAAQELETAKLTAERECATKASLLNFLSHELRNPLHAMSGILDMLEQMSFPSQIREWHQVVASQVHVAETIAKDVLMYQSTDNQPTKKEFSLPSVMSEVTHALSAVARCKGLALEFRVNLNAKDQVAFISSSDPDSNWSAWNTVRQMIKTSSEGKGSRQVSFANLFGSEAVEKPVTMNRADTVLGEQRSPLVMEPGDEGLRIESPKEKREKPVKVYPLPEHLSGPVDCLRDIIENLLIVAIKCVNTGCVKMTISCVNRSKESCLLSFSVKDMTGTGLSGDLTMFTPSANCQNSSDTGKLSEQTCLCIAVVHLLVKQTGGNIEIKSLDGGGTTVTVELPMDLCNDVHETFRKPTKLANFSKHPDSKTECPRQRGLKKEDPSESNLSSLINSGSSLINSGSSLITSGSSLIGSGSSKPPCTSSAVGVTHPSGRPGSPDYGGKATSKVTFGNTRPAAVQANQSNQAEGETKEAKQGTVSRQITKKEGQIKVLVVDDNQIIQKVESKQLTKLGFSVDVAENGAVAVEKVNSHPDYDVILMDLNMPVMDGLTAAKTIREAKWSGCLFAVTANTLAEAECLSKGFDAFISKPIKPHALAAQVKNLLKVRHRYF